MANVISVSSAPLVDLDALQVTKSGSNNCLLFLGGAKSGATPQTLTLVSHGTSSIVVHEQQSGVVNTLLGYGVTAYALDPNIDETSQTVDFTWGVAITGEYFGSYLLASDVDQTTPLGAMDFQNYGAGAATARSYTAVSGDIVYYVLQDTNSVATTTPAGFTRVISAASGTSQIDQTEICYKEITSNETSTVIAGNIAGNSLGNHYCIVINGSAPAVSLESVFPVAGADATGLAYKVFDSHNLGTANVIDSGNDAAIANNQVTLSLTGLAALNDNVLLALTDFTASPTAASEASISYSTVTAV